eukprot:13229-Heterococcus_DN1.PRE.1
MDAYFKKNDPTYEVKSLDNAMDEYWKAKGGDAPKEGSSEEAAAPAESETPAGETAAAAAPAAAADAAAAV